MAKNMSGFSSFGPGGPSREGGDREEQHLRDGKDVAAGRPVKSGLTQAGRSAIMGPKQEKVPSSMPEVAPELRGLSLEQLQQKERDLHAELDRVERELKYNIKDAEAGLVDHAKFLDREHQLSGQRTDLFYQIEAVQNAIEVKRVWQEVPEEKK